MIRSAIMMLLMLLVMVVLAGYMMLWIMMPTNTFYYNWLPYLHSKTDTTHLGTEGATILIFTFPVLFIATMACLYLQLGKKYHDDGSRLGSLGFDSWRRPTLVGGPLGIVCWTELVFLAAFVALMAWSLYSYLRSLLQGIASQAQQEGLPVWAAQMQSVGLSFGLTGNICLGFMFFPVTRGSSVLQLFGITSESSIKYHIWLGHIAMALFTGHGLCYIITWIQSNQSSMMTQWTAFAVSNLAGEITLLSGLFMWATSFGRIRRKIFELFYYTHHFYILFFVFYAFHVGFDNAFIVLPGVYLFMIDRFLRFLQSQHKVRVVAARILPCDTVELNFAKSPGLKYSPTSIMFLNLPGISKLQWHPFTVTSNSNTDHEMVSVVIKCEGGWTNSLYQMLSSASPTNRLQASVEGPYGPTLTHYTRHDSLVMVSGGSGITPFISIIREILYIANTGEEKRIPKILLISCFKKSEDLAMLDLLLPVSGTNLNISRVNLQVEAYITREKQPKTDSPNPTRTVWFRPNESDTQVWPVLGQWHWLCLGAIISTSFVAFLILIGILIRYDIFTIDQNTNTKYSLTARSAWNMLFICTSIVITASVAFIWNKKQDAKKTNQVQSASSRGRLNLAERELESLPHQSLIQANNLHFGERPNLKKILLEIKGDSIGVLASGPRKLRQEVALICSAGLGYNLHFESISFTW